MNDPALIQKSQTKQCALAVALIYFFVSFSTVSLLSNKTLDTPGLRAWTCPIDISFSTLCRSNLPYVLIYFVFLTASSYFLLRFLKRPVSPHYLWIYPLMQIFVNNFLGVVFYSVILLWVGRA